MNDILIVGPTVMAVALSLFGWLSVRRSTAALHKHIEGRLKAKLDDVTAHIEGIATAAPAAPNYTRVEVHLGAPPKMAEPAH